MADFSFKNILWKPTFQVNLTRAVVAGIVWTIIAYFMGMETPPGMPGKWLYMFIWPIGYLLFFLPLGIVAGWLNRIGIPFVGLLTFIPAMMVIPADPIMFILHKVNPNLVPVDEYRFIEPSISIWVYDRGATISEVITQEVGSSSSGTSSDTSCPFVGRILVDKETKVLGFSWPAKSTAFQIHDDWSVSTPGDRNFGWIDVKGEIHKGRPFGGIDPKATLSGGNTGIKIVGDSCWVGNDKIGHLVRW